MIQWTSFGGVSALKTDDRRPAEWIAGTERLDKLERLAADAFVPLVLTEVRGYSLAFASLACSAAVLAARSSSITASFCNWR